VIKRILKYFAIFLVSIASLYGIGRLSVVMYDSYKYVDRQPYLQKMSQNGVVVMWQTPQEEKGCVHYGEKRLDKEVCEDTATQYHSVALTGLQKETRYHYSVDATSIKIDNSGRSFETLNDDTNRTQRIWVLGDSGNFNSAQQENYKAMMQYVGDDKKIDTWLMLGDNAYRSGTQEQFNRGLFNAFSEMLKRHVLWPVIGNHDARRWAFYDIFEFPTNGESGGVASGSERYFSFENGNIHFVLLDSQTVDRDADGEMAQWLKKDLAVNKKLWTIAIFHHPPYTKGSHDSDSYYDSRGRMVQMRENIVPILEAYDVDLVLSGHSHVYERSLLSHKHYGYSETFDPAKNVVQNDLHTYHKCNKKLPFSGTIYNVAGSFSENTTGINPFNEKHPMMPVSFFTSGSLLITADQKRLKVEMVMRTGEILDTYEILKSENYCKTTKRQ